MSELPEAPPPLFPKLLLSSEYMISGNRSNIRKEKPRGGRGGRKWKRKLQ